MRGAGWVLSGNVVYAASQWAVVVALAKLTDPATVGLFALALALTAPVYALLNLNLRNVLATDASDRHPLSDYAVLRAGALVAALPIIGAVAVALGYGGASLRIVMWIGLCKAIESAADLGYGLYQHSERLDRLGRSMGGRGVCILVAFVGALWWTGSLEVALAAWAGAQLAVVVTLDLPAIRRLWRVSDARARPLLLAQTAAPLGLVIFLSSLSSSVPRAALEQWVGPYELGIFAAFVWLVRVGQTAVRSVGQAMIAGLARKYSAADRSGFLAASWGLVGMSAALGALGVVVAELFGPTLLRLMYTPDYAEHASLFTWVMVAGGVSYVAWFLTQLNTAARQFTLQVPIAVAVAVATVAAAFVLVPEWGARGAALSWLAGALTEVVCGGWLFGRAVSSLALAEGST